MTSIDPDAEPTEIDPPAAPAAPAPPADVEPDAEPVPARARGSRFVQVTAIAAVLGVIVALAGIWVATRPVSTPVQDCGAAAAFLLDGRVNVFADPEDPPVGLTRAQVVDNNDRPCQERAANQAAPGAVMIVAGTLIGLVAATVEVLGRWSLRHRARTSVPAPPTPETA